MRRGLKRGVTLPPLDPGMMTDLTSLSLQPARPRPGTGGGGVSSSAVSSARSRATSRNGYNSDGVPPPPSQDLTPPVHGHKVAGADAALITVPDSEDSRKMTKYLRHHPELPGVTADLMDAILAARPDDIAAFAADAFFSGQRAELLRKRYRLAPPP